MNIEFSEPLETLHFYFKNKEEINRVVFLLQEHEVNCPHGKDCIIKKIIGLITEK